MKPQMAQMKPQMAQMTQMTRIAAAGARWVAADEEMHGG